MDCTEMLAQGRLCVGVDDADEGEDEAGKGGGGIDLEDEVGELWL